MDLQSISEAFNKARNYWLAYIGLWIFGILLTASSINLAAFLTIFLSIGSTILLFYTSYKRGKSGIEMKPILVLGVGINAVFFIVSMFFVSTDLSTLKLEAVGIGLVFILLFLMIATIIILAGYSLTNKPINKNTNSLGKKVGVVGFIDRFIARLIDTVLIWMVYISTASVFLFAGMEYNELLKTLWTVFVALWFIGGEFYYIYFHHSTGQTIGKKIMKIKVVRDSGKLLTWKEAFIRWIGYKLSLLSIGLGLLWIAVDKNKQGWHDKIAKTIVIKSEKGDKKQ